MDVIKIEAMQSKTDLDTHSGVKLNIRKSIEHHILKNRSLDWNKRNY